MEILTIRDVDPEDEAEEEVLKMISKTPSRQRFSTMTVSGNRLVQFKIDTGTCNLILKRDLQDNTAADPGGKKTLHFYNGAKSPTLGTCQLRLKTRNGNRSWQIF